ncbi:MAG: hemerythrin domain-containing protein [Alphaproteobacteria bacterium]
MTRALRTIKLEHGNLFSVLHCLRHLALDPGARARPLESATLRAILAYVEEFPDAFHHPKEEQHLFRALRQRRPTLAPTLDRLEQQHAEATQALRRLHATLDAAVADASARPGFEAAVREYVDSQRAHMLVEERDVLPVATEALTDEDWRTIDAAFDDNDDPVFGQRRRRRYEDMFRRIVDLAPPPFGFGDARS